MTELCTGIGPALYRAEQQTAVKKLPDPFPLLRNGVWPRETRDMVGTGWATSHPDCMDRLRKHCFHLVEGWFLARKAAWALSGCMVSNSADYCVMP